MLAEKTITWESYLADYAPHFYEWVEGEVIKMSPISLPHNKIQRFLMMLLEAYFELRPIGTYETAPYPMRVVELNIAREPDIPVILNDNMRYMTNTYMDGPADICIEVVSPESVDRDHGKKFVEYEKAGVAEYWIIDPLRNEPRFYRLDDEGTYLRQPADEIYTTPKLPGFRLHIPTLWRPNLPGYSEIGEMVKAMLEQG